MWGRWAKSGINDEFSKQVNVLMQPDTVAVAIMASTITEDEKELAHELSGE